MKKLVLFVAAMLLLPLSAQATVLDLTSVPAGTWLLGTDGSYWRVVVDQPTGTGVYQPFLRYQNKPVETGLNTDHKMPVYDGKMPADKYTRSVLFADLGTVQIFGGTYWSFTIDFNEPGSKTRFLSFDNYDIYQGTINDATSIAQLSGPLFDSADTILADYTMASSGSGRDDIEFLIPAMTNTEPYFYLFITSGGYSTTTPGAPGYNKDWSATGGFEEIRTTGIPSVPEPSTMLLLGFGLVGLAAFGKKRRFTK